MRKSISIQLRKSLATALSLALILLLNGYSKPAHAASYSYGPGQTLTLTQDLILTGSDIFEAIGTAQQPCTIEGNGFHIKTVPYIDSHVTIQHCTIHNLGTPDTDALSLLITGSGYSIITDNVFDASSSVYFYSDANSIMDFSRNTVLENSIVPIVKDAVGNRPFFYSRGPGLQPKSFKGNHIYKSFVQFEDAQNWMVGGSTDADSNIIIGFRAGIGVSGGSRFVVKGNYIYALMPINNEFPYWTQVATYGVGGVATDTITEDNVIRHGEWNVRGVKGQFRNNVVLEMASHSWIQSAGPAKIHHNIFAFGADEPNQTAGINVATNAPGTEIYNNTFDGGGLSTPIGVPALELSASTSVDSLRSNVFYRFAQQQGVAMVENGENSTVDDPNAARLGYADYNLFYSPDSVSKINYITGVSGKTMRTSAGFGLHDARSGGPINEQVEPKFKGPIEPNVPFSNTDVKSGAVTVSQILAHYRDIYTPAAGSPLIDAGDPADGAGTDIGAIDAGANPPAQAPGNPSVKVTKQASTSFVYPGESIKYFLTIRNVGMARATNIQLTDSIPALTTYIQGSIDNGGVLNGNTITWSRATLDPNESVTVSFSVLYN